MCTLYTEVRNEKLRQKCGETNLNSKLYEWQLSGCVLRASQYKRNPSTTDGENDRFPLHSSSENQMKPTKSTT